LERLKQAAILERLERSEAVERFERLEPCFSGVDLPAYTNTHHDHEHVLSSFIPYPFFKPWLKPRRKRAANEFAGPQRSLEDSSASFEASRHRSGRRQPDRLLHGSDQRSLRKGELNVGHTPAERTYDQWRICFTWKDDGPHEGEIVDYH
jgi:plasmid maintenance system killer protein